MDDLEQKKAYQKEFKAGSVSLILLAVMTVIYNEPVFAYIMIAAIMMRLAEVYRRI